MAWELNEPKGFLLGLLFDPKTSPSVCAVSWLWAARPKVVLNDLSHSLLVGLAANNELHRLVALRPGCLAAPYSPTTARVCCDFGLAGDFHLLIDAWLQPIDPVEAPGC